jgi:hypothetical protein
MKTEINKSKVEAQKPEKKFEEKILDEVKEKTKDNVSFSEQLTKDLTPTDLFGSIFQTPDQEKDKILETLFEHPDLRKVADISHSELIDMTVLLTFEKEMDSPLIEYFCETRLALSFSKDRKSREEIVEIYKTNIYGEMMGEGGMPQKQGMFSRFKNRFSGGLQ